MRRALTAGAAAAALLAANATTASGASGGGLYGSARAVLAQRLDSAIQAATRVSRRGIVSARLAGVAGVVVGRDASLADVRAAVPGAVRRRGNGVWSSTGCWSSRAARR